MTKLASIKCSSSNFRRSTRRFLRRTKTLSIPRPRLKRQTHIVQAEARPPLLVVSSSQSSLQHKQAERKRSSVLDNGGVATVAGARHGNGAVECAAQRAEETRRQLLATCLSCMRGRQYEGNSSRGSSLAPSDNDASSVMDDNHNHNVAEQLSQSFESCHLLNVPSMTSLHSDTSKHRRASFGSTKHQLLPTTEEILSCRSRFRRIGLNIGGTVFQTLWKTLDYLPNTRLGRLSRCESHYDLMELCDGYELDKCEFYFDRNSVSFGCILDFYRTGVLHMTEMSCVLTFSEDLTYWGVNEIFIYSCCLGKYHHRKEQMLEEIRKETNALANKADGSDSFTQDRWGRARQAVWNVMDKPNTSKLAKVGEAH